MQDLLKRLEHSGNTGYGGDGNYSDSKKRSVMNRGLIFPAVIAAVILSGCSGGQQASLSKPEKDKLYIETVRDKYPKLVTTDKMLLELAAATCSAFDSGASKSDVINVILLKGRTVKEEMGFAVGAAVPIYCPEHQSKI